jgi:hypothetical protein
MWINEGSLAACGFLHCCISSTATKLCVSGPVSVPVQGKPSRSLQAAWKLISEGNLAAGDVAHLERGLYGWYQAGLPIDGECAGSAAWVGCHYQMCFVAVTYHFCSLGKWQEE